MIAIVVSVCSLLANSGKCKDVELVYADVSLMTCMMAGMPEVARWADQNPNWTVKRWRCEEAGRVAKI
jgi:hypothetical protein